MRGNSKKSQSNTGDTTPQESAYEKLMGSNSKAEFDEQADLEEKSALSPQQKIKPHVTSAQPYTRPLDQHEIAGGSDVVNMRNKKTGMVTQISGTVAQKWTNRYPGEFEIVI